MRKCASLVLSENYFYPIRFVSAKKKFPTNEKIEIYYFIVNKIEVSLFSYFYLLR